MAQLQYQFHKNDEYFTPPYAVYPVMERLKAGAAVWCPFDKAESAFVRVLSENGFRVTYGHIQTGQDFFHTEVPDCDYIISNPPYSLKGEVLKRLYEIGKPFAMLINFQGIFDSRERFRMFKENRDGGNALVKPKSILSDRRRETAHEGTFPEWLSVQWDM